MNRYEDAKSAYNEGLKRVKNTPEPEGQKFHIGQRVFIKKELLPCKSHFECGRWATIEYTHAHAYGGESINQYSLNIDGSGSVQWYSDSDLSADEESKDD